MKNAEDLCKFLRKKGGFGKMIMEQGVNTSESG